MRVCFNCKAEISGRDRVPFKELCPKCEAFLHCCKNCRLYAPEAHNHCLSSTTEAVPDAERANYCDEFEFRQVEGEPRRGSSSRSKRDGNRSGSSNDSGRPMSDSSSGSRQQTAREKFEGLFKD